MTEFKFHQKALVLNQEDKFLVLKRAYTNQKWDLPGGAVELPETHQDALCREIKEETGLEITDIKPECVQTAHEDDGVYTLFIGYSCRALLEEVILSHEHTEFSWVSANEFLNMDATAYLKDFVRDTLGEKQAVFSKSKL